MNKFLNVADKLKNYKPDTQALIKDALLKKDEFLQLSKSKKDWTYEEHDKFLILLDLKKENGYYIDKYNNKVSYNGIKTLKKPGTELNITAFHKSEIKKCKNDFKYFRKYYCKIQTRQGLKRPEPREYQSNLETALLSLEDIAVSFSRQSGKSVTTGTYLLWRALFHPQNINIGIVANKPRTARELLTKIKQTYMLLPIWLQQPVEVWNKSDITLADTSTRILTDSPSADSFRGDTISLLYCDEVAYINRELWDEMLDSIIPTMSSLTFKQLIYTSTMKGKNHWANIVKQARLKTNEMILVENDWHDVPHYDKKGNILTPQQYKKTVIKKYGRKFFLQTEENIPLGSSDTLIAGDVIQSIEQRVETIETKERLIPKLQVYKKPKKNHTYIISVDSSKDGKDDFSINVTDVTEFPFEQVAWANIQIDYIIMPEHLDTLGRHYNNALIIVENNEGSGQSITDTLWGVYEYENLYRDKNIEGRIGFKKYTGFRTTQKSRKLILNMFKVFIEEDKLIINSDITLQQLYTFVLHKSGKYKAEEGYKDDAIMSLAIMFAPFMENTRFDDYKLFVKELKVSESKIKTTDFINTFDVGGMEDGTEDYEKMQQLEDFKREMQNQLGDYSIGSDYSVI
jgi:hypothetical protein